MRGLHSTLLILCIIVFALSLQVHAAEAPYCFQIAGPNAKGSVVTWTEGNLLPLLHELNRLGFKLYASHFRSGENLELEAAIKRNAGIGVSGYAVYKAVNRVFGNWEKGLLALGIDPLNHNAHFIWNRNEVLALLRYLQGKIQPLSLINVRTKGSELIEAYTLERFGHSIGPRGFESRVIDNFKTWDKALRAIGIDPKTVHSQVSWNSARVIQAIQVLSKSGFDLSVRAMTKEDNPEISETLKKNLKVNTTGAALHDRGIYYFGSWDNALKAADLNPNEIRLVPPKFEWTRTDFFTAMKALEKNKIPLNFELLASDRIEQIRPVLKEALDFSVSGNALVQAARTFFGSWVKARDWYYQRKAQNSFEWSRDSIQKWIQYFRTLGLRIDELSVVSDFGGRYSLAMSLAAGKLILTQELFDVAESYFGSWRNALLQNAEGGTTNPNLKKPSATRFFLNQFRESKEAVASDIQLLNALEDILINHGPQSEALVLSHLSETMNRSITIQELKSLFSNLTLHARGYE